MTDEPETHITTDLRTVKDVRPDAEMPPTEWADKDQPLTVKWPYRTTIKSTGPGSALLPPGSIVELLPHEVAKHHKLAKDVLEAREKSKVNPAPAKEGEPAA
jgi:hypothetical protein